MKLLSSQKKPCANDIFDVSSATENKSLKQSLREYRYYNLTILQWMALLALAGIVLSTVISVFS